MIVLDTADKSLTLILGASPTTEADYVAVWRDVSRGQPDQLRTQQGTTNGTTAVTVGTAPSGDVLVSQLLSLTVFNADGGTVTATLRLNDDSTIYEIWQGAIAAAKTLLVHPNTGITVLS